MKVLCVRLLGKDGHVESQSEWLTVGKVYHVLEVVVDSQRLLLRLIGDAPNEVALFPLDQFEIVSGRIPTSWSISWKNQTLYFGPPAWDRLGFWEDYYDRKPDAISIFQEELRNMVAADP